MMRPSHSRVSLLTSLLLAASHLSSALDIPQNFKNTNLLRTIDLSGGYVREIIAVIIENISKEDQSEYYIPFTVPGASAVSYVDCKDKKDGRKCNVESLDDNSDYPTKYYKLTLPSTLKPNSQVTLTITAGITGALDPLPATISQNDKQFLAYFGDRYAPSAYLTEKQKTKVKAPNGEIPDFTVFTEKTDPEKSGYTLTYGPYENIKPGAQDAIALRYEFTNPLVVMDKLERDIEVSHWGNNLATEERYWMTNKAAKLKDQFSRLTWATTSYYNPPTAAIKGVIFPLHPGSKDVYFTDDVGNVSTSRLRQDTRETVLDIKPRYPVFGGWNYSFVIGWNNDLPTYLRKGKSDQYILKVPLLQGPAQSHSYGQVEVRIILPEGATNLQYSSPVAIDKEERFLHKTFLDTTGRPTLKLTINNVVDDLRGRDIIVTYGYNSISALRKPLVVLVSVFSIYLVTALLGRIDLSIGK